MNEATQSKGFVSISKETLAELPIAEFNGTIHLVETLEELDKAINFLSNSPLIGFDTETRPSFHKGHFNKVALLQLATLTDSFLIRINKLGFVEPLIKLLENPKIKKVGLSIKDDFHNLQRLANFEPKNFVDLQSMVPEYRISDLSLAKIYGILFDKRISKGQRLTNWEADSLTEAQQMYASLDASSCIEIYDHLLSGKFEPLKSKYFSIPEEETTSTSDSESLQ